MGNGGQREGANLGGKFARENSHSSGRPSPSPLSAAQPKGEGWLAEKWQLSGKLELETFCQCNVCVGGGEYL